MKIVVCPLSALETSLQETAARSMISLSGPGKSPERPDQISDGFLALEFNDITAPANGLIAPNENHISALISFFQDWNQASPLLIHCWMGISRSTAAAVIAHACLNPGQDMQGLAKRLRAASPSATPNRLMIEIADATLQLKGCLSSAIAEIGRGASAYEGTKFRFDMPQLNRLEA